MAPRHATAMLVMALAIPSALAAWNGVCTLETNTDFIGHDVSNAPAAKPIDCCTLCQWRLGCAAYSWKDGICYFKTGRVDTAYNPAVTSGVVGYQGTTVCPVIQVGLDFVGNDIGNLPGATVDDCCARCGAIAGCGAVSWSEGVCYFKTGMTATVAKDGVKSGVVRVVA